MKTSKCKAGREEVDADRISFHRRNIRFGYCLDYRSTTENADDDSCLNEQERKQVMEMLYEYKNVFSLRHEIGTCPCERGR